MALCRGRRDRRSSLLLPCAEKSTCNNTNHIGMTGSLLSTQPIALPSRNVNDACKLLNCCIYAAVTCHACRVVFLEQNLICNKSLTAEDAERRHGAELSQIRPERCKLSFASLRRFGSPRSLFR